MISFGAVKQDGIDSVPIDRGLAPRIRVEILSSHTTLDPSSRLSLKILSPFVGGWLCRRHRCFPVQAVRHRLFNDQLRR